MTLEAGGRNKTCTGSPKPGNCCPHTQEEAAGWDFNVRGKCWVLRSVYQTNKVYQGKEDIYGGNHPNNLVSILMDLMKLLKVGNDVLPSFLFT